MFCLGPKQPRDGLHQDKAVKIKEKPKPPPYEPKTKVEDKGNTEDDAFDQRLKDGIRLLVAVLGVSRSSPAKRTRRRRRRTTIRLQS